MNAPMVKKAYMARYASPLGEMMMASDGVALRGLWFCGQKYFAATLPEERIEKVDLPIFAEVHRWLDIYFSGKEPDFTPPLAPDGTAFRQQVWRKLQEIPYGASTTYGALSCAVAEAMGKAAMSAQAVGGAVGHNPISIIIPCHRVIGADGSLTGYAGGIERKLALLKIEGQSLSSKKV
ncbi:MAG: methylated-DNA--[protein]-cysteine S-methyltransferase [Bacteroidales bacterium]|nr:methylated-DNA--[protein]-cysteine S-methyltransferase [Bacteroidales bacterium]